ncbi:MAG: ImmA/IrrE family metallo-endopeptidase [Propionibacteriales bacterium]|nr:ImmA/IrrE family metallo-endopeptidase [Propionibacteriales bacterium]
MFDPEDKLESLGVHVVERDLSSIGVDGLYDADTHTVFVHDGLTPGQRRATLAHELAHAERGEGAAPSAWHEHKQERRADTKSARWLVGFDEMMETLRATPSMARAAEILRVDVDTLRIRLESAGKLELIGWMYRRRRSAVATLTVAAAILTLVSSGWWVANWQPAGGEEAMVAIPDPSQALDRSSTSPPVVSSDDEDGSASVTGTVSSSAEGDTSASDSAAPATTPPASEPPSAPEDDNPSPAAPSSTPTVEPADPKSGGGSNDGPKEHSTENPDDESTSMVTLRNVCWTVTGDKETVAREDSCETWGLDDTVVVKKKGADIDPKRCWLMWTKGDKTKRALAASRNTLAKPCPKNEIHAFAESMELLNSEDDEGEGEEEQPSEEETSPPAETEEDASAQSAPAGSSSLQAGKSGSHGPHQNLGRSDGGHALALPASNPSRVTALQSTTSLEVYGAARHVQLDVRLHR